MKHNQNLDSLKKGDVVHVESANPITWPTSLVVLARIGDVVALAPAGNPRVLFDWTTVGQLEDWDYTIVQPEPKEEKPWRVEKYGDYYHVSSNFEVEIVNDWRYKADNRSYEVGNYFRTKEEAQKAAETMKKALKEFRNKLSEK